MKLGLQNRDENKIQSDETISVLSDKLCTSLGKIMNDHVGEDLQKTE
jgi:hypothetical protein